MQSHTVSGGGGCKIHVTEQGSKDAPTLLFVHGWAQHNICWQAQSPLAENFRLVALDLRGHGASETPPEVADYTDATLWGNDIYAVIKELDLKNPILVGWSYGARVISSYVATHGQDAIAGIVLIGGVIAIGAHREPWMMGEGSPALNKDLYTSEQSRLIPATVKFVDQCTFKPLDRAVFATLVAANMLVSAFVRRALFAGDWDCRPVWQGFAKPALVIHGTSDEIVLPAVGKAAAEALPNASLSLYDETGHAPFAEHPARFNAELADFATKTLGVSL
ncbi:alpha/beta hydrolase [Roseobacter sp. N2S]|uniref:alpha/beta fold hydrolase n=1 Tax=Roseobacter sp. N2S TaxID=2663844 RepID=UPI00285D1BF1|nr:alpha/beta hydrolase [Roseobacter sp. N2S]MDR6265197.1 pimeloyl-ACP methyl ester carboxylesterase [Roseobacter sp. N2S]